MTAKIMDLNLGQLHPKRNVYLNLSTAQLVEHAIQNSECKLSESGALIVETGVHTGRSPLDKFIVDNETKADEEIAWGLVNKRLSKDHYNRVFLKVVQHLENKDIYSQDVWAGNHSAYTKAFRIISEKAWAVLFSQNLLIPATNGNAFDPEYFVFHAPTLQADPITDGTTSGTFIIINFDLKVILIGGTSYAGEIKKSVFSVLNRVLPENKVLPMHCSANVGTANDTALFFGLSGTGKTTLSSSPDRALIGDDEHGWGNDGIFNFEGGCYAKTINLKKELEPIIWEASQKFGSVLENVGYDEQTRKIDFDDGSRTENTRAAYPLRYIKNHVGNGRGDHPKNIFFLSADAFGVLPPISLLTQDQAVFYFLLGYTAKLAGTEKGLGKEPEATFSTCFGEPFLPLSPIKYATLLMQKLKVHQPRVWLINTGWTGGPYGIGSRVKLPYSRAMIRSALKMESSNLHFRTEEIFGLNIPDHLDGVPDLILNPINSWKDTNNYTQVANKLISKIMLRMELFSNSLNPEILKSGPHLP